MGSVISKTTAGLVIAGVAIGAVVIGFLYNAKTPQLTAGNLRDVYNIINQRTTTEVEIEPEGTIAPAIKPIKNNKFESKGERYCRQVLETRYKKPFPNRRPDWNINPKTGCRLELDCYNAEMKLAIEYNDHKKPYKDQSQKSLEYQQACDQQKKYNCKQRGVTLIVVPYHHKDTYDSVYKYLTPRLDKFDRETGLLKQNIELGVVGNMKNYFKGY